MQQQYLSFFLIQCLTCLLAAVQAVPTVMFWDPAAGVITSANANTPDETPGTAMGSHAAAHDAKT